MTLCYNLVMKEAMLYEKLGDKKTRCYLCNHGCRISQGSRGICGVRENIDGTLMSLVYGKVIAMNVDPVEKKPLFHFLPGSKSLSIATVGCNFRCDHCQNFEISQYPKEHSYDIQGSDMTPEEIVENAEIKNCASISYTYTEPTIFFEFAYDCARLAHEKGIKNIFVSNGYTSPEAAEAITPYLDANNIDFKGDEEFYRKVCGAKAEPVKETIKLMKKLGVWVEITTLVIPGFNNSDDKLRAIAEFIKSVDPSIPWHVTQFHPTYKMMNVPSTPVSVLKKAYEIGHSVGLKHVYVGNVPGDSGENTFCPNCKTMLIKRIGFSVAENKIKNNRCPDCGAEIEGVWE